VNTYLDDPLLNLAGTQRQRDQQLTAVLLLWSAAGFQILWAKGTRSKVARWIGLNFEPDIQSLTVKVSIPPKTAQAIKDDALELLDKSMLPVSKLRRLAGKGGWIMNLLPKARWTVQRLWGAIAEEERCKREGASRQTKRGGPRTDLVARRQVEAALRWLVAFWGSPLLRLERTFGAEPPEAEFELIFDASPWGLGGVLIARKNGIAIQYFDEALTLEDCSRFEAQIGDAKGQQYWEALAVLVGLKVWAPLVARTRAAVRVKSDSVTALACACKLASSSALMNGIGAEMALVLEVHEISEVLATHVPGQLNDVADALSRLAQPGAPQTLPPQLLNAKRRRTPHRDAQFWTSWVAAVGPRTQKGTGNPREDSNGLGAPKVGAAA